MILRKPQWLKKELFKYSAFSDDEKILFDSEPTVCVQAKCPNRGECFANKTAAFLLLGTKCSRKCSFCGISTLESKDYGIVDATESDRIARLVEKLELEYLVLTSVTRDDLADGGVSIFIDSIKKAKKVNDKLKIEILIPDFKGDRTKVSQILDCDIDVFNHNIETVERLFAEVKSKQASFERSLDVLQFASQVRPELLVKSGFMVGLGETKDDVRKLFERLAGVGVKAVTVGQYLMPHRNAYEVKEYIEDYDFYIHAGKEVGIPLVEAGAFVRSSFRAFQVFNEYKKM
jgi:lipoic acid synthetase